MNQKKQMQVKSVHRFTQNVSMKFRPIFYKDKQDQKHSVTSNNSVVSKFSSIFGSFFTNTFKSATKASQNINKNKTFTKSTIIEGSSPNKNKTFVGGKSNISPIKNNENRQGSILIDEDFSGIQQMNGVNKMQTNFDIWKSDGDNSLIYLQKITIDTFLIGNRNQLDLITISGIYDNLIDTDVNWSLNVQKKIKKLAVDNKKCLLAMQCQDEIYIYSYDNKRLKSQPVFLVKTKLLGIPKILLFLKDSQLGVFYETSASIYQIEQNSNIRLIFNKKYGINQNLKLYQIPKPIQNVLNIFFIQKSNTSKTYILWRLQLQFKIITPNHNFKSIVRIYDIPSSLVNKFKIDNFSKDIMILNFKFEILAAKDGFIIDAANTNIQQDGSCLVYQGDHLLHISQNKLFIYGFKVITSVKPNKIDLRSLDSIQIKKDPRYSFFDCLQMLNGNFVLFFQVKPEYNNKLKGEIDYIFTVTQKLSIQQKLNEIFNFKSPLELKQITQNNFDIIQQKCDMAFKIGLNRKQVYLQLWNKSQKKQIGDYKFLLDTMDYDTIKTQIQKKLKKASMPFNEVYKIQQACYEMLRADLFSNANCNQKAIKNYLVSHFLLRKLIYFKYIYLQNAGNMKTAVITNDRGEQQTLRVFVIDIQQYVQTIKFELKSHFLQYVNQICEDKNNEGNKAYNFRIFLRQFKFPLRIIYSQLLQSLIIQSKNKLINFLKIIPDILPYQSLQMSVQDFSLYQGLWGKIMSDEWIKNLHIQQISTIYNKDYIQQLTKTVWFKRNQNTMHDLVALSKQKIIQIQQFNQSDGIFYFFIQKIFQYSNNQQHLIKVVDFLQTNYNRLPIHLKGKIFLYKKLFNYFARQNYQQGEISSFNNFLKLRDHQLFKQLFRYQKVKKGCLLKQARKIYQSINNGMQMYHEGLLNYFASDLSQISDLKYILNRLNNQKRQFHIQNEGIYAVLVRAMQMKLKLGSDNDIPLDEVMIYVENIPLSKNNPIIEDLKTVDNINQQSGRFKKMKINMSLLQIIQNCEDVVTALINEQIKQKCVFQINVLKQLIKVTYDILAQVQTIKQKIYGTKYRDLPYFIYLSKLLQSKQHIFFVGQILKDKNLLDFYCVDDRLIQNLVLYMYKWKFSQESTFVKNRDYLQQLLTLLPQFSQCRNYIQSQIQFAIMLSTNDYPIQYPLTQADTISIEEIAAIINNLKKKEIKALNLNKLHEVVQRMQQLCVQMQVTTIHQIYQVCIMRLIKLNDIRDAIPMIKQLINRYGTQQNYSIIFCFFVVSAILNEMPQIHKKILLKICFYTFNNPQDLLIIIEKRINTKLSNDEQHLFLQGQLQFVRMKSCLSINNQLIDKQIITCLNNNWDKYYHKIQELIFQTWIHLSSARQDFQRNCQYTFYFIMLLHNPYSLAKYVSILKQDINIRLFRSFLSYVFKEDIFDGQNVLYLGRRIFMIALEAATSLMPIEVVASQYIGNDLSNDQLPIEVEEQTFQDNSFAAKLHKSIQTFNKKISSFKVPKTEEINKKQKRVEALLSSEASIQEYQISQYPFNDSDDNYEDADDQRQHKVQVRHKKRGEKAFDANKQRKIIMQRQGKNLALYLSNTGEQDQLHRTSPKMLKSSKTFQHAFHSVNFSKHNDKKRKVSDNFKNNFDVIDRSDSIPLKEEYDNSEGLVVSQSQDELFRSAQPILLRPMQQSLEGITKTYSPEVNRQEDLSSPTSPMKLINKNSLIEMNMLEQSVQNFEFAFKVNIQQINDEQYTPVQSIKKQLLADIGLQTDPIFDLSILAKEQQKQFGEFQNYLRQLIQNIYYDRNHALSLLLQLIKQIKNVYPSLGISSQFLDYYIALENYNIKYKSQYLIRQMFPVSGIFLSSKDPIALFQFVKGNILDIASYDRIVVIAQLLTTVLRKLEIKDDLYFSYLARQIEAYGNDNVSSEMELKMQRERIEGMLPQITTSTLFIERGEEIMRPITGSSRYEQVAGMIKEALRKKKREYLIRQFEKKLNLASS